MRFDEYYGMRGGQGSPAMPPDGGGLGLLIVLAIAMLICALLGSCKARVGVLSERVVYDTVWSVRVQHDTVKGALSEHEIVRIVPHIVRVGDTTIVYSDTMVLRTVSNNSYVTRNVYQDRGHTGKDSITVVKATPQAKKETALRHNGLRWLLWGVATGLTVALIYKYRRCVLRFIERLARRMRII